MEEEAYPIELCEEGVAKFAPLFWLTSKLHKAFGEGS